MARTTVRFGEFQWDARTRQLRGPRGCVTLQDKPNALLGALIADAGSAVSRRALHDSLWPADVHVERDAGLNTAVRKLRAAFREVGSNDADPIETIPRLGYQLCETVDEQSGGSRWRVGWFAAAAVASLLIAVAIVGQGARQRPIATSLDAAALEAADRTRYTEARALMHQGDNLEHAAELLGAVTANAPRFASAHAFRAEALALLAFRGAGPAFKTDARAADRAALDLDSDEFVAERALALLEIHFDRRFASARARLDRALRLSPGDPVNHIAMANLLSIQGVHDAAVNHARRAINLAPETMTVRADAGYFLLRAARFNEAATECALVLRLAPGDDFGHRCLARVSNELGDATRVREHAMAVLNAEGASAAAVRTIRDADHPYERFVRWNLERMLNDPTKPAIDIATAYAELGDLEEAAIWLDQAFRVAGPMLVYAFEEPRLRSLINSENSGAVLRPSA